MNSQNNSDNIKNNNSSEGIISTEELNDALRDEKVAAGTDSAAPAVGTDSAAPAVGSEQDIEFAAPVVKKKTKKSDAPPPASLDDSDDFIFARYHGKRSHSYSGHSKNEVVVRSSTESISKKHHRHSSRKHNRKEKWKQRSWWQKLLIILGWILSSIVALLLIAVIAVAVLNFLGLAELTDYEQLDMTAPDISSATLSLSDNGRIVKYKGETYKFNEDMTSILCIGVDKTEMGLENNQVGTAGQADALYIIALDTDKGTTKVIAVPRDIVTDIGIYSTEGEYLRTEKMQICLAYAYGDGLKTSCTNTVTAVSRLFYQLPINSYYAINLSAIDDLNDAVGGVTVTMLDNSFYDTNQIQHFKGETLTLHGDNARKYLQYREVSQLHSTTDRLERQVNYLKSFTSEAIAMTKSDIRTPVKLYNIVKDNSVTNLTTSRMTAFASCIVGNGVNELDFVQVPGSLSSDGTYAQYNVDDEKLFEMILDIYYNPLSEN